jgi:hypothetical protein
MLPVGPVGRDPLNPRLGQGDVQRITVIGLIPDQALGEFSGKGHSQRCWDKGDLRRRSRGCVDGEQKTRAVCHRHELRTLAPLALSHVEAPFFATIQLPSMKHSPRLRSPRSRRPVASASSTWRKVRSRTHCWQRRWQVWSGGKRPGQFGQRAPLRRSQRLPLRISRVSRQGRPRPSARRGGTGISGSMRTHCSFVGSSRRAML